jgi:hypothetical protein
MAQIDELKARLGREADKLAQLAQKEDDEIAREAKFKGDTALIEKMFLEYHRVEQITERVRQIMETHSGTDADPSRAKADGTSLFPLVEQLQSAYDSLTRALKKLDNMEISKERLARVLEVQAKMAERMLPHFRSFEKLLNEIASGKLG